MATQFFEVLAVQGLVWVPAEGQQKFRIEFEYVLEQSGYNLLELSHLVPQTQLDCGLQQLQYCQKQLHVSGIADILPEFEQELADAADHHFQLFFLLEVFFPYELGLGPADILVRPHFIPVPYPRNHPNGHKPGRIDIGMMSEPNERFINIDKISALEPITFHDLFP